MHIISRKEAELFYAAAFAVCHIPDARAGRWVSAAGSNEPISTLFKIQTRFGVLEVSVRKAEWIPRLGFAVNMRFADRPEVLPEVGGIFYDRETGKWNIAGEGKSAEPVLAELTSRLDWAQGIVAADAATAEQGLLPLAP